MGTPEWKKKGKKWLNGEGKKSLILGSSAAAADYLGEDCLALLMWRMCGPC